MMIDSVVWAQYINVTDRHTDSHVALANATQALASDFKYERKSSTRRNLSEAVDKASR